MNDLMKCDSCGDDVQHTDTASCMAQHLKEEVRDLIEKRLGIIGQYLLCSEGVWHCSNCLNPNGYCRSCSKNVSKRIQKNIKNHSV